MKKLLMFVTDGFEEIEAVEYLCHLRRGGVSGGRVFFCWTTMPPAASA